jgi:hypothetical protein
MEEEGLRNVVVNVRMGRLSTVMATSLIVPAPKHANAKPTRHCYTRASRWEWNSYLQRKRQKKMSHKNRIQSQLKDVSMDLVESIPDDDEMSMISIVADKEAFVFRFLPEDAEEMKRTVIEQVEQDRLHPYVGLMVIKAMGENDVAGY